MITAGLLVISGALLYMILFGFKVWALFCLLIGAIIAIMSISIIKKKLFPAGGRALVIYNTVLGAVLLVTILVVPALLDNSYGPEKLDRAVKKSASLLASGDLEGAELLLKDLAEKYPEVSEIQLNLSTAYLMQGKPEEAAGTLDASKQLRYFNADECFNYALSYYQREDYADAMVYLKNALDLEPDMEEACLYAAECSRRLDDYKAAGYFSRRFIEIRPDLPQGYVQSAKVDLMLMEYGRAAAVLEKALELNPGDLLKQEILSLKEEIGYYQSKL
ncbi:tetratricopeptide repeat protein [Phosphitispora sp. TUW77]|uniref:tetratricopeptide repeat protein n=1 Tax=Phosphitispora sp. TUW77 TaxID=3152361 RepID=UPI003AB39EEB